MRPNWVATTTTNPNHRLYVAAAWVTSCFTSTSFCHVFSPSWINHPQLNEDWILFASAGDPSSRNFCATSRPRRITSRCFASGFSFGAFHEPPIAIADHSAALGGCLRALAWIPHPDDFLHNRHRLPPSPSGCEAAAGSRCTCHHHPPPYSWSGSQHWWRSRTMQSDKPCPPLAGTY